MKPDKHWKSLPPEQIPSTLELSPALFEYITPESRILDLGCGNGNTCADLYNKGYAHIYGSDINRDAIEFAREKLAALGQKEPDKHFIVSGTTAIPFPDENFDCLICHAVWTLVLKPDRLPLMREITRMLRPGGTLCIADFARTPRVPLYKERYINGIKKGYDEGTFEVKDETGAVEFIAHHYTAEEFAELISSTGLRTESISTHPVHTRTGNEIDGLLIIASKPA